MIIENKKTLMMDIVLKELKNLVEQVVIKVDYMANKTEDLENLINADEYCYVMDGTDTFYSYGSFSEYAILKSGLDPALLDWYVDNKSRIPEEYRDDVLKYQREYIIDNYVELNNYYRCLAGMPNLEDRDLVYVSEEVPGVDTQKPIDKMTSDEIIILELNGYIKKLIEEHPDKSYLRHLSDRKIPIHIARKTPNHNIMYLPKPMMNTGMDIIFTNLYTEAKTYVLDTLNDRAYSLTSEYFESFLGVFIMTITMQRFISSYYNMAIRRDFFDKDLIRFLFESYGLPFYDKISLAYLKKVAKNLNRLLQHKATDQVFIDILALFNMRDVEINSYYLVKNQKLDYLGNPIFEYMTDEEGHKTLDIEKTYDLRFVQVPKNSKNISLDLIEPGNHLDYELVINDDVLWGDGEENRQQFMKEIMEHEFNYIQTKYISITSKYEITKLNFELCYFFRLLVDCKENEKYLEVKVPMVKDKCNIFDVIVGLFAITCMKMGFDGNIMDTITKTMSVMGFNLKSDVEKMRDIIDEDKIQYFYDEYFKISDYQIEKPPSYFKTPTEITELYLHNKDIHDKLIEKKYNSKSLREYNAYKRIYEATMTTKYNTEMYRLKDGRLPETYLEYLQYTNPGLYYFIKQTTDENMIDQLDTLLITLENYFKTDKFDNVFLNIPSLSLDNIKRFIYYLIDIFKSYTVDLTSMNIIYHIDSKYIHNIKLVIDEYFQKYDEEFIRIMYRDELVYDFCYFELVTNLKLKLGTEIYGIFERYDKLAMNFSHYKEKMMELKSRLNTDFFDNLDYEMINLSYKDVNTLKEDYMYQFLLEFKTYIQFKEYYTFEYRIDKNDKLHFKHLHEFLNSVEYKDKVIRKFMETIDMMSLYMPENQILKIAHNYVKEQKQDMFDIADTDFSDEMNPNSNKSDKDRVTMRDVLIIRREN